MLSIESPSITKQFFRVFKPWELLLVVVYYFLGVGLARFSGNEISLVKLLIGLTIVLFIMLASFFLQKSVSFEETSNGVFRMQKVKGQLSAKSYLLFGYSFISAGVICLILLIAGTQLPLTAGFAIFLFFTGMILYSLKPLRIINQFVSEILYPIILTAFLPVFSYFLQSQTSVGWLLYSTIPLVFLLISRNLANSLENYKESRDRQFASIMETTGWRTGTKIHNILVLVAFLLMGLFGILGQPWRLIWPGLLALPVGIFQIWQIILITQGGKPRWKLLALAANSLPVLPAYFLVLSLWLR
jgi:1,4-dihydroxy-2-naphthoate octaprenyltransferase